jgi:hypothetical protein
MKQAFLAVKLSLQKLKMIDLIESIVTEYQEMGYRLTLRQLYYQLVSRDIIPNKQSEYAKTSSLLKDARMMGLVDWAVIEDRLRVPRYPYFANDAKSAVLDVAGQFRMNRQAGQPVYLEVWVEKDALSSIIYNVTEYYGIKLMVNRGYTSCSAMHDAYKRMLGHESCMILYLGDHDPSGLDMVRDIGARFLEFGLDNVQVQKIALTTEQVKTYNPPPNPAKITDPRAKAYIEKFGPVSWEVDALKPDILDRLLRESIKYVIDMEIFEKVILEEKQQREKLFTIARGL